jgi:hypothetical protein
MGTTATGRPHTQRGTYRPPASSIAARARRAAMFVSVLSALGRQANCRGNSVYQHRNSGEQNDPTEHAVKGTERVAGKFRHIRRNAIMRPTPVAGCQRNPQCLHSEKDVQ